ncbi:hypothetical protein HYN59_01035 [Flavobacterium album]|uniref:Uncharacterized protein n=1 Tax=Flavobacterium album TaxID=2175091 RepID=A0A2S1QTP2_9FLAO|nr:T9SS type A sorting domain-containing protein [Flavobacterium album]AWH83782.1 hypothetical protein HYN59_01035 [Flavobacterium album]
MKNSLLCLALLLAGSMTAQTITIPDVNFKNRLLSTSSNTWLARDANGNNLAVDANGDGEIQMSEALQVHELNFYFGGWGGQIQSMQGIEYFTNLEVLDCGSNAITSLDVTALTNLRNLNCRYNGLQSLNVNGLANLENIEFEFNPAIASFAPTGLTGLKQLKGRFCSLASLDLSLFPALEFLECGNNQLTALDATAVPLLTSLQCGNNQISSLTLTGLSLESLSCGNNPLPGLDVSEFTGLIGLECNNTGINQLSLAGFTALKWLSCSGNPITSLNTQDLGSLEQLSINNTLLTELDLSHSPNLPYFSANNNPLLTSINMHNGTAILYPGEVSLENNPVLQYICVDEGEEDLMLQYFEWHQQIPVYMSSDCTFVPNQVYNTISGDITFDFNNNGCDTNDTPASYTKLLVSNGTEQSIRYTGGNGHYSFYAGEGAYTVTADPDTALFVPTPATASFTFAGFDGQAETQDFCMVANGTHNDAEVVIMPIGGVNPGFDAWYNVVIRNNGNQTLSGTVTFIYNGTVLHQDMEIPAADSYANGSMSWNYSDLMPFETRLMTIRLHANGPTDTPALNIDDALDFSASVTPFDTDENPNDNNFELHQIVTGSYDPNNIVCLEGETESINAIGDYLHYAVNFENTGNAAATFVVVTQQIDEAMFDPASLELMSSTHPFTASLTGNMLELKFENINLGPQEQGQVLFKMKTLQSLHEGDEVMSRANIVFDYNFGIATNEAVTLFEAVMGVEKPEGTVSVTVYPNPARNTINIMAQETIRSAELFDINGRLLQTAIINDTSTSIDLSSRAAGMYFVKVITEKGMKVEKVIRE